MKPQASTLAEVRCWDAPVHRDRRGFLWELWQRDRMEAAGLPAAFAQVNHSRSEAGVLRGLHWQRRAAQGKLVTVVSGRIWDVVVEVRRGLPDSGQHRAFELTAGMALWIPSGLAHGFAVLGPSADVVYALTEPYQPTEGRGVRWDDPALAIPWPVRDPVLSDADQRLPWWGEVGDDDLPRLP